VTNDVKWRACAHSTVDDSEWHGRWRSYGNAIWQAEGWWLGNNAMDTIWIECEDGAVESLYGQSPVRV
jgi:hypothetical protein